MNESTFQLERLPANSLEQSIQSANTAMADFARQAWSPQTLDNQRLLEATASTAAGAGSGALLAMGGLYLKDRATELATNMVRVPIGIGLSIMTGRMVNIPAYEIQSNLRGIAPKGALIGGAVGLATYAAYKAYENYYSK